MTNRLPLRLSVPAGRGHGRARGRAIALAAGVLAAIGLVQLPQGGAAAAEANKQSAPVLVSMSKADAARAADLVAEARRIQRGGDFDQLGKVEGLYRQAYELGDPVGTAEYAFLLLLTPGMESTGLDILQTAVAEGSTAAMTKLGIAYTWGKGVPQDDVEAARHIAMAAELGDPEAIGAMGFRYFKGIGVSKDAERGLRLMQVAANDDPVTALTLGQLYLSGEDLTADVELAAELIYGSLKTGLTFAQSFLSIEWNEQPIAFRKAIQSLLKADGYYRGPIDGEAGPGTQAAIQAAAGTDYRISATPG